MTPGAEELLTQQLKNDVEHNNFCQKVRRVPGIVSSELGLTTLLTCPVDVYLLIFIRMVRLVAFHGIQLILIVYLKELKFDEKIIGLFMTLTFSGDLFTSFILSIIADNVGRRNIFMFASLVMMITGSAFIFVRDPLILIVISFIGIMTPGGDVGPFKSLESSSLASLIPFEMRSDIYAWYGFLPKCFASLGVMGAGCLIGFAENDLNLNAADAYRTVFISYVLISFIMFLACYSLSPAIEWKHEVFDLEHHASNTNNDDHAYSDTSEEIEEEIRHIIEDNDNSTAVETATELNRKDAEEAIEEEEDFEDISDHNEQSPLLRRSTCSDRPSIHSKMSSKSVVKRIKSIRILPKLSRESYITVAKLSALFALDAFASSFIGGSWQSYYILHKFHVKPAQLGSIFFVTGFVSGLMSLLGSTICKRLGPILTMVITHLPASILIAILPLPSTLEVTFLVLVLRACVQSMDAAPKQVFLSAIVPPTERTSVLGWVNVVKTLSHTVGPSIAGYFLSWDKQWACFVLAGILKVAYDFGILITFMSMNNDHLRI